MSENFLIKMEIANEYKRAIRLIQANREIGEMFLSTLRWLERYSETNGIPLPEPKERITKAIERMETLLAESDESYHRDESAKKLPEPGRTENVYIAHRGAARNNGPVRCRSFSRS